MRPTTFSEVESIPDLILDDRGELWIPEVPGLSGTAWPDGGLRIKRVQITPPTVTIGQMRVPMANFPRAFAGHRDVGNLFGADFYEDSNGDTTRALTTWQKQACDPLTDNRKRQREYSVNCELCLYDPMGRVAVRSVLTNVWPSVVTMPIINSNGGSAAIISVQFSVDFFDPMLVQELENGKGLY